MSTLHLDAKHKAYIRQSPRHLKRSSMNRQWKQSQQWKSKSPNKQRRFVRNMFHRPRQGLWQNVYYNHHSSPPNFKNKFASSPTIAEREYIYENVPQYNTSFPDPRYRDSYDPVFHSRHESGYGYYQPNVIFLVGTPNYMRPTNL